ncbi:MAG: precorrin-2 C(20)-methyltransferase [Lachnospiraceae bacterium]|nr:precorrin-2 C(20)-methyltransferase [Lachnospiraceae bacterium]
MRGIAYGVGVGPGDPELMTLKAVRLIKENDIIAVPGKEPKESVAYRIAAGAVPEIENKTLVPLNFPMVKDRELIDREHKNNAKVIEKYLDQGKNVVFLTLGDSTVYCTFSYVQHYLETDGYTVELVNGIPSFCAAAARLNISLTEWNEALHIIPASHETAEGLSFPGTNVLMKSASRMKDIKKSLKESGKLVQCVENCGMENEKVYKNVDEIPDDAGYFSLIIAKDTK